MTNYTFRPAVRQNVALIVGLIGGTGSGKTWSAMTMAKGIAGEKKFCVIDTENGRASHYADHFAFDVCELRAPFHPDNYADAILAADKAGYPVIVVDSMSHVWAGDGGVLDWQDEELDRMAGTDWKKREACKMAAWIKPKMAHKHMVQKLLQVKAHLILCFRAEEKIEIIKEPDENGRMKTRIVPKVSLAGKDGWIPICEKNLPFELTASFLLLASKPGFPNPIKLQEQHKALFPLDKPINAASGQGIALWAAGGRSQAISTSQTAEKPASAQPDEPASHPEHGLPDPLLVKAQEFAELGTEKYMTWIRTLSEAQTKHIGKAAHERFKAIAAKVPV